MAAGTHTNSQHRDDLFAVLCRVHSALERSGIWHCLFFGTLLGAVREGDLISWDHDIDLLMRPADVDQLRALNSELRGEGLSFWTGKAPIDRLALNTGRVPWFDWGYYGIMDGTTWRGEIYTPTLFDDGVLRHYDLEQEVAFWPQSSFPAFFVEELKTVPVRGVAMPVPLHAEKVIEWLYGRDWRTPYRSVRDGGEARPSSARNGDVAAPNLREQIAWCEAQGWDRRVYRGQPAWPRALRAAGPTDQLPRATTTSRSSWWHTLDEVGAHY